MKIGILTFHRAINYGAVLQCYALYRTLCDMGHDVEVIDYRPDYVENDRRLFFIKRTNLIAKIRILVYHLLDYKHRRKASKIFDKFLNNYLKFSPLVNNAKNIPDYYDYIFFGSDQIWNPRICAGFDKVFWGQFPKGKTKFVSYAASLGTPQNIAIDKWDAINEYIKTFDRISVREGKLLEFLKCKIEGKVVLDPTLLASRDIFESIAIKPKETKFVLLYMLEPDRQAISFAEKIAKLLGCNLIRISAVGNIFDKRNEYKILSNIRPEEFLGYFKYADYIVNVSFHGTAFSVIFNKNFYTLKSKNFERAYGLLKSIALEERFVLPTEKVNMQDICYGEVNKRLDELKRESIAFIQKAIQNN